MSPTWSPTAIVEGNVIVVGIATVVTAPSLTLILKDVADRALSTPSRSIMLAEPTLWIDVSLMEPFCTSALTLTTSPMVGFEPVLCGDLARLTEKTLPPPDSTSRCPCVPTTVARKRTECDWAITCRVRARNVPSPRSDADDEILAPSTT